jgi:hypothetical protein
MMAQTHLPLHWRYRLLRVLELPETEENLRFLQAWATAEGGTAERNPLNTTYKLPFGSWDYNTAGVKNYATPLQGIAATALTLDQDYYATIRDALRPGTNTAEEIVQACRSALKTWGTNPDVILAVLKTLA